MVMFMKECSKLTKCMDKESIYEQIGLNMLENGKIVYKMDLVKKPGLMELSLRECL